MLHRNNNTTHQEKTIAGYTRNYYRIKAKPSFYGGTWFRSRLEAIWARYFDLLHVRWVYEPTCVSLPSGPYKPDFILFDYDNRGVFAEIKHEDYWKSDDFLGSQKLIEIVQKTQTNAYLLMGKPNPGMGHFTYCYVDEPEFKSIDEGRHSYFVERFDLCGCPNVAVGHDYILFDGGVYLYPVRTDLWGRINPAQEEYEIAVCASEMCFDSNGIALQSRPDDMCNEPQENIPAENCPF
jgi:hypothetical protein